MGDSRYYGRFLEFFQQEVKTKPCETSINRYLFEGYKLAEELVTRLFTRKATSYHQLINLNLAVHPLIHLVCGVEFTPVLLVALREHIDLRCGERCSSIHGL